MKSLVAAFAAFAMAACLCGCGFLEKEPYRKVCYYDIVQEPSSDASLKCPNISGVIVSSDVQYSSKMLFKTGLDSYEYDEFNRWLATPDVLLKRSLEQLLLHGTSSMKGTVLKVIIRSIEMDPQTLKASCSIAYSFDGADAPATGFLKSSVSAKSPDAAAFAESMRKVFSELAIKLAAEAEKAGKGK